MAHGTDQPTELATIAERNGFPPDATEAAFEALRSGRGQAQFSHPALGGMGQWSPGMTMIGDMFNADLKGRVDRLFHELAKLVETHPSSDRNSGGASDGWWPADLGRPASSGSQNDLRYAVFPDRQRIAIWRSGNVAVYDTGGRAISGAGQQQAGSSTFTLTGPDGTVSLEDLKQVATGEKPSGGRSKPNEEKAAVAPTQGVKDGVGDPLELLDRLADLHARGVLNDSEFAAKKAQLLARVG